MKKITLLLFFTLIFIGSCNQKEKLELKKLNIKYDSLLTVNKQLSDSLNFITNTPSKLFEIAKSYESAGLQKEAYSSHLKVIEKFPNTEEAKKSKYFIENIKKQKELEIQKAEREKRLGFKVLDEHKNIHISPLDIKLSNYKNNNQWIVNRYERRYFIHEAERDENLISYTLKITSKIKNPSLPEFTIYRIEADKLEYVTKFRYEFYRESFFISS